MPTILKVKKVHHFTGHTNSIYAVAKGTDDRHVITAAGDGIIAEWDVEKGGDARLVARVPTQVFSVLLLPQHNLLVVGQLKGGIHILDLERNEEIRHLTLHEESVFDLHYDERHNRLLAAAGDGYLSVWSVPEFDLLLNIELSKQNLRQIAFQDEGDEIAVGCSADHVHILDRKTLNVIYQFKAHDNSVFSLAYFNNDHYLATGSRDAYLKIWDVRNGYVPHHSIPAHIMTINDIAVSPDGEWMATGGRDKEIKIWSTKTYDLLKVIDKEKLEGHIHSVNRLRLVPYHNYLISAGDDRQVMVWEISI